VATAFSIYITLDTFFALEYVSIKFQCFHFMNPQTKLFKQLQDLRWDWDHGETSQLTAGSHSVTKATAGFHLSLILFHPTYYYWECSLALPEGNARTKLTVGKFRLNTMWAHVQNFSLSNLHDFCSTCMQT